MFDNVNKGVLFKNIDKKKENGPDYSGKCNLNGIDYKIASWLNTSKKGQQYLSLKFQIADEEKEKQVKIEDLKDDIPF